MSSCRSFFELKIIVKITKTMKKYFIFGLLLFSSALAEFCTNDSNSCVTFSVAQGTGCAWMCNYCAQQLGTNNYYFTTPVCTYETGGCVGNPIAGNSYSCCSA